MQSASIKLSTYVFHSFNHSVIIILAAELLHIFIHFFIGHLSEDHGDEGYQNYRSMLML